MFAHQHANYMGAFTYEFGGAIDAVEVAYHRDRGGRHHVIKHLNGKPGTLKRHNQKEICPSIGSILFGGGSIETQSGTLSLSDSYLVSIVGRDRVADRSAWVMEAVPRDRFRYGVSLTLDEQTGLPLRVMMMNSANAAIERLQFVSLAVSDQKAETQAESLRDLSCDVNNLPSPMQPQIAPRWLPRGFVLAQHDLDARQRSVSTYTDGIASFTLFTHQLAQGEVQRQGLARRGATLALLSTLSDEGRSWQVALVGEVPAATAKQVIASLQTTRRTAP